MRSILVLLPGASLFACAVAESDDGETTAEVEAVPAGFTFEGADADDRSAILRHGERLTHVLGCTGCHRDNLQGGDFGEFEEPLKGLYASNLTQSIGAMDDSVLETLLRDGVHPERGDMYVMPSAVLDRLSASDMQALIAYLRTLKPEGERSPPPVLGEAARELIEQGVLKTASASVADYRAKPMPDLGEGFAYGRYLAGATCAECHGPALEGAPGFAPALDVASAYSREELKTLLTTGKSNSGRDLGLMGIVGAAHFGYLTDRERTAIVDYVEAYAARAGE